ncbi:ABC transporter ATP-binding protein [Ralstonia pseudosolanacearum]|uniref:ABC transporter ATP-binding protein n=1 Tax=Ralstonia solanacearum TaxID=305 RepID=A0AA92JRY2_RALSL|nr:ABC transporter ATP-binding protein [Ralstonia pseudosolanacearum]QOK91731.1 ABC transporter ATP-binding protein [Ralstonia pseudosolanacearum]QOK96645.1 ABC transporter ATP-binding protein [Ralstonia pseudosolanacearum]
MAATTPMLDVRGLHAYYGKSHILHGVDLHVGEGEIVALLGRNGVGRSTLAKSIMGMVRCEGHILLRGKDVRGLRTFEVAHRGIGYVPENRDIFPTLTVRQNLLLGEKRNPHQPTPRWQLDDMYRLFHRLKERENTPAGVLSGGEQQMLTLCRTLMGDPDFVIIDEPTEGLAPLIVAQVGEYLKTLKARGISVLLVEQKLAIALDISQRVYVMGHGQIVFEGTPADLKADARVRQEWLEV